MTALITKDLQLALSHLRNGDIVAFPTETVYGLGADAKNPLAIQKVFLAKDRPADHPLIVHIASVDQLSAWAKDIPPIAYSLAQNFWPGPLTMILRKQAEVSPLITGGQDTVGIRIPNHPLTLELLAQFGSGLVGPSANKYGRVSPTSAQHVADDLNNEVAAILDGGACSIGIESTIISLVDDKAVIMRQGDITAQQLAVVLGYTPAVNKSQDNIIRSSGSHESHYAPLTPVYLLSKDELISACKEYTAQQQKVSVLSFSDKPSDLAIDLYWQTIQRDPKSYAHNLYANLRAHDQLHNSAILIEQVAHDLEWAAITDRLVRASFK